MVPPPADLHTAPSKATFLDDHVATFFEPYQLQLSKMTTLMANTFRDGFQEAFFARHTMA
jgi:hypothetical protein